MNMLLAVLEKRVGFKLSQKDVFLNISGGIKIDDPACDLAIIAAILSSNFDIPLSQRTAFIGEAGLSGEIRPASQTEKRIAEAAKLGFEKVFISKYEKIPGLTAGQPHPEIIRISTIADLVKATFR
jgi:DNA repair protein RadA/Sms